MGHRGLQQIRCFLLRRCSADVFRFGRHALIIIILIVVIVDCRQLILFAVDLGEPDVDLADIDVFCAGVVSSSRLDRLLGVCASCCLGNVGVLHIRKGLFL